jgi:hypothetical protein
MLPPALQVIVYVIEYVRLTFTLFTLGTRTEGADGFASILLTAGRVTLAMRPKSRLAQTRYSRSGTCTPFPPYYINVSGGYVIV